MRSSIGYAVASDCFASFNDSSVRWARFTHSITRSNSARCASRRAISAARLGNSRFGASVGPLALRTVRLCALGLRGCRSVNGVGTASRFRSDAPRFNPAGLSWPLRAAGSRAAVLRWHGSEFGLLLLDAGSARNQHVPLRCQLVRSLLHPAASCCSFFLAASQNSATTCSKGGLQ